MLVPSQWEKTLQSNVVSHLLGANLESALYWRAAMISEGLGYSFIYSS